MEVTLFSLILAALSGSILYLLSKVVAFRARKQLEDERIMSFPAPKPSKFTGNAHQLKYPVVQETLFNWAVVHGSLYRLHWGLGEDMLVCSDPLAAQHLLLNSSPPETWLFRETVKAFQVSLHYLLP